MKVLHLIQRPQLRGAEVFASQLATHIEKAGHQVALAAIFAGEAKLPFEGKIYQLEANARLRFADVKAWKKLAIIIKKEQPDIIQANAGDTLKYAVFSKLFFRWKQPIVFRNASIISLYIKSRIVQQLNDFFFRHTDAIISVSITSALDIAKLFPNFNKSIITIPVGIEGNDGQNLQFLPVISIAGNPVLVHVGGFSFEKNHIGLIQIFQQILGRYPAAVLHLVGDGPLKPQIQELVKQKQLETKVVFHGFQKNPLQIIGQADAMMLPSIIEGLPGVVLEAFYCKTPVVAYDTGGVGEIVINNKTGVLVPKNNEQAFVDGLINLLENKEKREWLTANAYELVTGKYMNKSIADTFLNAYESIIQKANKKNKKQLLVTEKLIHNEYV